jgi:hypothetical protein
MSGQRCSPVFYPWERKGTNLTADWVAVYTQYFHFFRVVMYICDDSHYYDDDSHHSQKHSPIVYSKVTKRGARNVLKPFKKELESKIKTFQEFYLFRSPLTSSRV